MLNLNCYSNVSFGKAMHAYADSLAYSPAKPAAKKVHKSDESDSAKAAIEEGMFRYKALATTRPVMLSHTSSDCSQWLSQFDTAEERNLALKILQNYTYIDLDNARKAFRKLHTDLEKEIDIDKTKFATLGTSKSGSMMGYLYRQANKMRSKGSVQHEFTDGANIPKQEKFLTSTQLQDTGLNKKLCKEGIENIVIIDDMIGDGDSLVEYFTPELVDSLKGYKNVYYMTLIKDPDGEKKVHDKFPDLNIKFRCAEEVHKYDSPENTDFTPKEKAEIDKMCEKYGNRIAPELVKKYDRSKLFVSFDWNTPGNTPMMFNYSANGWDCLFNRYNGLEPTDVGKNFDFRC